jgi:hypothetical protein
MSVESKAASFYPALGFVMGLGAPMFGTSVGREVMGRHH